MSESGHCWVGALRDEGEYKAGQSSHGFLHQDPDPTASCPRLVPDQLVRHFFYSRRICYAFAVCIRAISAYHQHLVAFTKPLLRTSARLNIRNPSQSLSLSEAVTQAVHHITFSLNGRLPEETLRKLQFLLVSNLSTHFAPSWDPTDPTKGSGRRCLLFSQNCPPRLVHAACVAAGVAWQDWARALRHPDFELFVNPGCIFARYGEWGTPSFHVTTLWEPRLSEADIQSQIRSQATAKLAAATDARKVKEESPKTLAQQLLEEDQEQIGEEILALIAHEVREPTWLTPILDKFPVPSAPPKYLCPPRREDSVSPVSTHSRSSSSSDNSESSEFSFSSSGSSSSMTSVSSAGSMEKKSDAEKLMSRREKARQARVFIDKNKKEVTSYEGGRTTVLTGGVMLGGPAKPKVYQAPKPSRAAAPTSPACWRRL